ncbi:MAG: ribosomal RNA small subunit methyltransferase A [Promethearchaeota archaeon]
MKSMNRHQVQETLVKLNLKPKKSLGQHFLVDAQVLNKIISEANLNKEDIIVEVGTGLGVLTTELSSKVKQVYSYEIDFRLFQYTSQKLSSLSNVEFFNEDILKTKIPYHNKVVSNIPYTITGPLFEKVFYNEHPPEGILIIENTLADRIFDSETYKKSSRISVSFNAFMNPIKKTPISPNSFYPTPKIKLALIKVKGKEKLNPFLLENETRRFFLALVAGIMPYKNKNIINALEIFLNNKLAVSIPKKSLLPFLKQHNIQNTKVFEFNIDELIKLCAQLFNWLENW